MRKKAKPTLEIFDLEPQVKTVLAQFTDFVHSATGGEGVVMLGRDNQTSWILMFDFRGSEGDDAHRRDDEVL